MKLVFLFHLLCIFFSFSQCAIHDGHYFVLPFKVKLLHDGPKAERESADKQKAGNAPPNLTCHTQEVANSTSNELLNPQHLARRDKDLAIRKKRQKWDPLELITERCTFECDGQWLDPSEWIPESCVFTCGGGIIWGFDDGLDDNFVCGFTCKLRRFAGHHPLIAIFIAVVCVGALVGLAMKVYSKRATHKVYAPVEMQAMNDVDRVMGHVLCRAGQQPSPYPI